jgi:hypothetical protein
MIGAIRMLGLVSTAMVLAFASGARSDTLKGASIERINYPEWVPVWEICQESRPEAHGLWSYYKEHGRHYDEMHSKAEDCTVYTDLMMDYARTHGVSMKDAARSHPVEDYIGPAASQPIDGRTPLSKSFEERLKTM